MSAAIEGLNEVLFGVKKCEEFLHLFSLEFHTDDSDQHIDLLEFDNDGRIQLQSQEFRGIALVDADLEETQGVE